MTQWWVEEYIASHQDPKIQEVASSLKHIVESIRTTKEEGEAFEDCVQEILGFVKPITDMLQTQEETLTQVKDQKEEIAKLKKAIQDNTKSDELLRKWVTEYKGKNEQEIESLQQEVESLEKAMSDLNDEMTKQKIQEKF